MIAFNPTPSGGRFLRGEMPCGKFLVVWDKDGNIIQSAIEMLEPSAPPREAKPVDPAVIEQKRIEHEAKEQTALPGAWERVVKGSIGLAKVALGVDRSTDALIESRKAICEECPWLTGSTCQKCGCLYRAKIRLASEECPINKW